MSKLPSEATQIRYLKRELSDLRSELANALTSTATYRARATKAEREAAEWKQRFDILLRRDDVSAGREG